MTRLRKIIFAAVMMLTVLSMNIMGCAMNKEPSVEIDGGVVVTYQPVKAASAEALENAVMVLKERLHDYKGAKVYVEEEHIIVAIPKVQPSDYMVEHLANSCELYLILEYSPDGTQSNLSFNMGYSMARNIEDMKADGSVIASHNQVKSVECMEKQSDDGTYPAIEVKLDANGTETFAKGTELATKNGWYVGIFFDGKVVSVPKVNGMITGGSFLITGISDLYQAKCIAACLRGGILELELEPVKIEYY